MKLPKAHEFQQLKLQAHIGLQGKEESLQIGIRWIGNRRIEAIRLVIEEDQFGPSPADLHRRWSLLLSNGRGEEEQGN